MGSANPEGPSAPGNSMLRRRMNILERAASKAGEHTIHPSPSSQSRSSIEDYSDDSTEPPTTPNSPAPLDRSFIPATPRARRRSSSSQSWEREDAMSHKSWYQFDLIVLAALVSPLGHLLTGGDHVKNLLFIVLLIYYLHQVIEVPWNLYIGALPRKSVHSDQADADTNALAVNSLRRLEFVFLGMSLLSPLAGGALLHFVAPHITGAEPSSFFSTGLFMLATAIRPWRHLVKRLSSRTTELHDAIHYPPSSHSSSPKGKEREETQAAEIAEINVHLARFEKAIGKLRQRVGDEFDELYDNIENLERFASRQEKKTDRLDTKLKQVETAVANVQPRHFIESAVPKPLLSYILSFFPNYAPLGPMELTPTSTSSTTASNGNNNHKRRPRTTSSSGLATIPEEEASSSAPTYDGLPASSSANPPPNPYRRRTTTNPQPMGIGGQLFMVVTYPVGATWRLLSGAHA